jgi:hypothetical protein
MAYSQGIGLDEPCQGQFGTLVMKREAQDGAPAGGGGGGGGKRINYEFCPAGTLPSKNSKWTNHTWLCSGASNPNL